MRKPLSFQAVIAFTLAVLLSFLTPFSAFSESEPAVVTKSKIKVYASSDLSKSIGSLKKNAVVTLVSESDNVACISLNGKTGYTASEGICAVSKLAVPMVVNASARVYAKPSSSAKKVSVAKGTKVNQILVSGSWAMVEKNGVIGYMYKKYLSIEIVNPPLDPAFEKYEAAVCVSSAKVYEAASTSSKKLGTLKKGAKLTVVGESSQWAAVTKNGNYGYCLLSNLKKVIPPSPSTYELSDAEVVNGSATVTIQQITVYASASTGSKKLGTLKKNAVVNVHAVNAVWAYVSLNENYGYCKRSGIALQIQPSPTPSPAQRPTPAPTAAPAPTGSAASADPIFADASSSNELKIYRYLTERANYSSAVACGILANMKAESNFSPISGTSYRGLCQWSASRFSLLETWCKENGLDPLSLEGQLSYLKYDLTNRYPAYHKALIAMENNAQGAYDAGYYFSYYYERPADKEAKSKKRGNAAKSTYWPKYGSS